MKNNTKLILLFLCIFFAIMPTNFIAPISGSTIGEEPELTFTSNLISKQMLIYREFNNDSILTHNNDTQMNEYSYEYDSYVGEDDKYHVWEKHVNYTCAYG